MFQFLIQEGKWSVDVVWPVSPWVCRIDPIVLMLMLMLIPVCKILGAGSEADMEFQTLVKLGRATSTHMASVCAALDHCHVPGRSGEWQIPEGRMEIGLGLHNETVRLFPFLC